MQEHKSKDDGDESYQLNKLLAGIYYDSFLINIRSSICHPYYIFRKL